MKTVLGSHQSKLVVLLAVFACKVVVVDSYAVCISVVNLELVGSSDCELTHVVGGNCSFAIFGCALTRSGNFVALWCEEANVEIAYSTVAVFTSIVVWVIIPLTVAIIA
ncbi:Uncharacterised protein [Chlamydia trachomatis]|nr:Uncharacterised protein [Chlamydia trachomatis]